MCSAEMFASFIGMIRRLAGKDSGQSLVNLVELLLELVEQMIVMLGQSLAVSPNAGGVDDAREM